MSPGFPSTQQFDSSRTALKFRLRMPLFDAFSVPHTQQRGKSLQCRDGRVRRSRCLLSPWAFSLLFRHNNVRDILGHAARGAGLTAVVLEKKNQIAGSRAKPGDITVQQYHRGFASSAFDVTVTHPLQKKFLEIATEEAGTVAQDAHARSC